MKSGPPAFDMYTFLILAGLLASESLAGAFGTPLVVAGLISPFTELPSDAQASGIADKTNDLSKLLGYGFMVLVLSSWWVVDISLM